MYLEKVSEELGQLKKEYLVSLPSLWVVGKSGKPMRMNYASFLQQQINKISHNPAILKKKKNWTRDAIVYNCFVRFCTAYDHDQDGKIGDAPSDITLNSEGIRETGTFVKTIALLPYLKNLGINSIHLLPITRIGSLGRKGDLGSPYAIRNPYEIDPLLADPILSLSVEEQFMAFIEAAHMTGMRVVQEFIFRTASIDSDWSTNHPDWFYWIKNETDYGSPQFKPGELKEIRRIPKGHGTYLPPGRKYRDSFLVPAENETPVNARIASAFADWPPDDLQPPWTDVTYLRLFHYDYKKENNFNYIAYNTIRYYDPELARNENINRELWDKISGIIPYYQENFGIDGAMIDMGHALPNELKSEIINKARSIDPDFAFWDENFDNKEETREDGYNAVIGDDWYRITKRNGMKKLIKQSLTKKPLLHFGTAETHNSPRFGKGNPDRKKAAWLLFNLLHGAVPFLHNGFELDENLPVNTGLNFSEKEIQYFSKQALPLFFKNNMKWDTGSNMVEFIIKVAKLRSAYPWIFSSKEITVLETDNPKVLGFEIKQGRNLSLVLFNTNYHKKEAFTFPYENTCEYLDLANEEKVVLKDSNRLLKKGDFLLMVKS